MPLELARELSRQGQKRLDALISLATAADLRAATLCGIFGASAVAAGSFWFVFEKLSNISAQSLNTALT